MDKKTKNLLLIGGAIAATGTAVYLITRKRDEGTEKSLSDQNNTYPPMPAGPSFPSTGPSNIVGCTDPSATNYNPNANADNGSCEYAEGPTTQVVYGCMDSDALNFNAEATHSNNSCTYSEGCTAEGATNFDPDAFLDDGTCEFPAAPNGTSPVYGCTDELALNYDASATHSNNSCQYQEGCKVEGALNYNPYAMVDDGSCEFPSSNQPEDATYQFGCMDPAAVNHDPQATLDNGTCEYVGGCMVAGDPNFNPAAQYDDGSCAGNPAGINSETYVLGCMDGAASNWNPSATLDDGSCDYVGGCMIEGDANYNPSAVYENGTCVGTPSSFTSEEYVMGCMDGAASNWNPQATLDDGSCDYVGGCMIVGDPNYNPSAVYENGTCAGAAISPESATYIIGCMDPAASNWNQAATLDDGSCDYIGGCMIEGDGNYNPAAIYDDGSCAGSAIGLSSDTQYITGCTSPIALNWNPDATLNDGSCEFQGGCMIEGDANYNPAAVFDNGSCSGVSVSLEDAVYIEGCTNELALNHNPEANLDDGSCSFKGGCMIAGDYNFDPTAVFDDGSCVGTPTDFTSEVYIEGCTNSLATNYDETATLDNGTCDFVGGCMIQDDPMYNPLAVFDNGSCAGQPVMPNSEEYILGCTDPSATNYDETATLDNGTCGFIGGCMIQGDANYNPAAQYDDGSCSGISVGLTDFEYTEGCTSQIALNYNPDATLNDGSCEYQGGCTIEGDANYNPAAIFDDGSCSGISVGLEDEQYIAGCTNELALNFEPEATLNDGSCEFLGGCTIVSDPAYNPDAVFDNGDCIGPAYDLTSEVYIEGCTNDLATNYEQGATLDDGSCEFIEGCTLAGDANFNPAAVIDDGSCAGLGVMPDSETYTLGCTNPLALNYDEEATLNDGTCEFLAGCMIEGDPMYNPNAVVDNGDCAGLPMSPEVGVSYVPACLDPLANNTMSDLLIAEIEANGNQAINDTSLCNYNYGCTIAGAPNFDPSAVIDDGSCEFEEAVDVQPVRYGCMDPAANNYDDEATNPNNGCTYEGGCTNSLATNYDEGAIIDDGSCLFPEVPQAEIIYGCVDPLALNYDESANTPSDTCEYQTGCTIEGNPNFNPEALIDDGSCLFESSLETATTTIYGCTDPIAVNFNPNANATNNSICEYVEGCTLEGNPAYNPAAVIDNGSCEFEAVPEPEMVVYGCVDPLANNYNPNVNTPTNTCTYDEGCTIEGNPNYNPDAVIDDGSCVFEDLGPAPVSAQYYPACLDPLAENTLPEISAEGFEAAGFVIVADSSLCVYNAGCTNPNGLNYNPDAVSDSGLCVFLSSGPSTPISVDDAAIILEQECAIAVTQEVRNDLNVIGNPTLGTINEFSQAITGQNCLEFSDSPLSSFEDVSYFPVCGIPEASNYTPSVGSIVGGVSYVQDNSLCVFDYGCTDAGALNYDETSEFDDGSCVFASGGGDQVVDTLVAEKIFTHTCPNGALAPAIIGAIASQGGWTLQELNDLVESYTGSACFDLPVGFEPPIGVSEAYVGGCTDPLADNYNNNADYDDGSCQFDLAIAEATGCMDPAANNYDPNATIGGVCTFDEVQYDLTEFETGGPTYVGGCTDQGADNYNPDADYDDQSCQFDLVIAGATGCMNPDATNFDPTATIAGTCTFEEVQYDLTEFEAGGPSYVGGCTDQGADNYNPDADYDDQSCQFDLVIAEATGCMNDQANNYDPNATIAGVCTFDEVQYDLSVEGEGVYVGGCMNQSADNYDENADFDNGTCTFDSSFGCTQQAAQNYNPAATIDDGSCLFIATDFEPESQTYGCTYPQAVNYKPTADIDDGSCEFTPQSCSITNEPTPDEPVVNDGGGLQTQLGQ